MRRLARIAAATAVLAACSSSTDRSADTSVSPATSPTSSAGVAPTSTAAATITAAPSTTVTTVATTLDLAAAPTPQAIASELSRVELVIRSAPIDSADAQTAGEAQQRIFRLLADHPEWDDIVIAEAHPDVRASIALTIEARRAVVAHAATRPPSDPPTTLPAWTIRAPLPAATLLGWYREAEAATGVPWSYLAAINFVETRFGRIVGASPDGALGPMQFLPSTWAECCTGEITDDRDAIFGAATYLRSNGAPGDMLAALDAYNPNAGYVGAVDAYARNMAADERALLGYHAWQVYTSSSAGSIRLPVGYSTAVPIDAVGYAAAHPDDVSP